MPTSSKENKKEVCSTHDPDISLLKSESSTGLYRGRQSQDVYDSDRCCCVTSSHKRRPDSGRGGSRWSCGNNPTGDSVRQLQLIAGRADRKRTVPGTGAARALTGKLLCDVTNSPAHRQTCLVWPSGGRLMRDRLSSTLYRLYRKSHRVISLKK